MRECTIEDDVRAQQDATTLIYLGFAIVTFSSLLLSPFPVYPCPLPLHPH